MEGAGVECEPMEPDDDGWSEWIHPLPGYMMQCCDCGLVHDMEFEIGTAQGPDTPLNPGESIEGGVVIFRARRHVATDKRAPLPQPPQKGEG